MITQEEWLISFVEEMRPYFRMLRVRMLDPEIFINVCDKNSVSGGCGRLVINVKGTDRLTAELSRMLVQYLLYPWQLPVFGTDCRQYKNASKRIGISDGVSSPVLSAMLDATIAKLGIFPFRSHTGEIPKRRTDDRIPAKYLPQTFLLRTDV